MINHCYYYYYGTYYLEILPMTIITMYIYQYIYGDEVTRVNYQDPFIHWCIYYNTIIVIMYRNQPRPFFLTYYYYYQNIYIYTHKVYIYV